MNPHHFTQLSVREQLRALFTMTAAEKRAVKDLPGLNQRVRHEAECLLEVDDRAAIREARRQLARK